MWAIFSGLASRWMSQGAGAHLVARGLLRQPTAHVSRGGLPQEAHRRVGSHYKYIGVKADHLHGLSLSEANIRRRRREIEVSRLFLGLFTGQKGMEGPATRHEKEILVGILDLLEA